MTEWLADLVAVPTKEYLQFEAALSLIHGLPPDEAVPLLRQRCDALDRAPRPARGGRRQRREAGHPHLFMVENDYEIALLCTRSSSPAGWWPTSSPGDRRARRVAQLVHAPDPRRRLDARPPPPPSSKPAASPSASARSRRSPASTSWLTAARSWPCWGPTAPARPPSSVRFATLVRPDGGSLAVDGIDAVRHPARVRRIIGLAGQHAAVEEAMTGRENLRMVARLFGLDRRTAAANADAVLATLGLTDAADRLVRTYSGGMRRRLDLGASLVGAPPAAARRAHHRPRSPQPHRAVGRHPSLVAVGTDVLLTTQYLDEADNLADQIVIIDHGRVIAEGAPAELKAQAGRDVVEIHGRRVEDLGRWPSGPPPSAPTSPASTTAPAGSPCRSTAAPPPSPPRCGPSRSSESRSTTSAAPPHPRRGVPHPHRPPVGRRGRPRRLTPASP